MIELSIIISMTREQECLLLIESLLECTNIESGRYEIIVVAGSECGLENNLPDKGIIKIIKTEYLHTSIKRNLGVKASSGSYLAFLDDDVIVNRDWIAIVLKYLNCGYHIVCGPTVNRDDNAGEKISNMILASIIGEANAIYNLKDESVPTFDNIYTYNCAIVREVWEKTSGFNEKADWTVDDTEFFYIAVKMGFKPIFLRSIEVKHKRRKFPFEFLRYEFINRKATGMNTVIFPEIFIHMPGVKTVIISYAVFPFCIFYSWLLKAWIILYVFTVMFVIVKNIKKYNLFALILPAAFFLTHIIIYAGFTIGMTAALFNRSKYKEIIEYKKTRYKGFESP